MPLEWQLLSIYWAVLEIEALIDPKLVSVPIQLPVMPWVMEEAWLPKRPHRMTEPNPAILAYPACRRE